MTNALSSSSTVRLVADAVKTIERGRDSAIADFFVYHAVSARVNNVRSEWAELMESI